jgi:tetratricopeptide (TPR) repeat protein
VLFARDFFLLLLYPLRLTVKNVQRAFVHTVHTSDTIILRILPLQASEFIPEDLEYRLQVAACYLRLDEFTCAMNVLQYVLDISPNNEKALFHYTFCLRALMREKEAIESLTQVNLLSLEPCESFSSLPVVAHHSSLVHRTVRPSDTEKNYILHGFA